MGDDPYEIMAAAIVPPPLRVASSLEALAGVVARRLADGWSWVPRTGGLEVLLPPETDPRRDWPAIWDHLTARRIVPHWAVGPPEGWAD